jgi:hypothetical protein
MEDGLRMERRRSPRESRESLRQGGRGTRRSEKAKVSEEALLTRGSKAKKPMNACVHTTSPHASPSTQTLSAHNKHKSEGFIAIVQDLVKINLIK